MENPEELLQSLEEFSKLKPRNIPRELEEYLCFVAKTGDPVYQWGTIKTLFREKLINVITEFYESCASMDIQACPNVEIFNYDSMKNFILEKLDTFVSAPFTVQRICELLTTPRKEYNRIDKYMRALEKNILVVSTTEPGGRQNTKNGEGTMNGIDSEHIPEPSHCNNDINVEEMDDPSSWQNGCSSGSEIIESTTNVSVFKNITEETVTLENKKSECSNIDSVITCQPSEKPTPAEELFISIELETERKTAAETETTLTEPISNVPENVQISVEPEISSQEIKKESAEVFKEKPEEPEKEPNAADNKDDDLVKDEDRIILTSTDSGIENISPESSTSSPENLQTELEITEKAPEILKTSENLELITLNIETNSNTNELTEKNADNAINKEDTEVEEIEKNQPCEIIKEEGESKDFEVSFSVEKTKETIEAKENKQIESSETLAEEKPLEHKPEPASEEKVQEDTKNIEQKETPMDVDSSSDKIEGSGDTLDEV